jgi:hypothetical protein
MYPPAGVPLVSEDAVQLTAAVVPDRLTEGAAGAFTTAATADPEPEPPPPHDADAPVPVPTTSVDAMPMHAAARAAQGSLRGREAALLLRGNGRKVMTGM